MGLLILSRVLQASPTPYKKRGCLNLVPLSLYQYYSKFGYWAQRRLRLRSDVVRPGHYFNVRGPGKAGREKQNAMFNPHKVNRPFKCFSNWG